MGTKADFSERQFELAVNIELLADARHRLFWVPSQPAEKKAGFDIALVPALQGIWALLGRGGAAPGSSKSWSGSVAPTFAASLFLQYKRPEGLKRRNAKQVPERKMFCPGNELPYFRYAMAPRQLETLLKLSRRLGATAEVCYAAPAFISLTDLNRRQVAGAVVDATDFLPVPEIDAFLTAKGALAAGSVSDTHHWTYGDAGVDGVLCSEPTRLRSLAGRSLPEVVLGRLRREGRPDALLDHLLELEEAVWGWVREERGSEETAGGPLLAGRRFDDVPAVRAALQVQSEMSTRGIGWNLLLGWDERELG